MANMKEEWRIFCLLMYKNFLVRKRQWKSAIFVQILLPVLLFLMVQTIRDQTAHPPNEITSDTYYPMESMEELSKISKENLLYYVPNNAYTSKIMTSVRKCLEYPDTGIKGFDTESDALNAYVIEQNSNHSQSVVVIIFKNNSTSKKFEYVLRTQTSMPQDLFITRDNQLLISDLMFRNYFIQLQHCLNIEFVEQTAGTNFYNTSVFIQKMPSPPHIKADTGDSLMREFVISIATIAFLIPLCTEANFAASEKFIGVNVLMAMNRVSTYKNLLSWLLSGLIFSILYITPIVILLSISFSSNANPFLYYSNGFIFWIFLILHMTHLLAFGMHIASYFSKPLFMVCVILVAYFCSTYILKYTAWTNFKKNSTFLGIFFPNILLHRAMEEVNIYEGKLAGSNWNNLFRVGDPQHNYTGSIGMVLIFSILGTIFHFNLANYIYAIKPGKYGVKKHPLYFLECFRRNKVNTATNVTNIEYRDVGNQPFEPASDSSLPGIQIRNLKKSYFTNFCSKTASVEALKGISIDFYKSHITALLGHNGAGKTTLMSILTGLISPSEGTILLNGKNISKDIDKVMNDMGLCPQDDILFPSLSVFEQLLFFGMLKQNKSKTKKEVEFNVVNLLKKLNLSDKRDNLPPQLSGGQKRRVCLGMALIGDANIIILDEPTSGMDPESRRDTWDIILGMREQKTILISTHNMEEADILGDRIAIIQTGTLRCYGTPMFLKKIYGQGNIEVTLSTNPNYDQVKIQNMLGSQAEVINVDNGRLTISVPYTDQLPESLDRLEAQKKNLGITGMSVSLITLEQVFLKVTKDPEDTVDTNATLLEIPHKVTGSALRMQRISALLSKKFTYSKKNWTIILFILLIPIIGVILMLNFNFPTTSEQNIKIDLSMYSEPKAYYSAENLQYGKHYSAIIQEQGGVARSIRLNESLNKALLNQAKMDNTEYLNHVIVSAEFNETKSRKVLNANAMYSGSAIYSLPISLNILYNAILKSFAGNDYGISLSTQTLPPVHKVTSAEEEIIIAYGRAIIFVVFIFPAVALYVIHPLRENMTGIKHLQLMTGTSYYLYWFTMFLFDFIVYFISSIIILIFIVIFDSILALNTFKCTELMIMLMLLLLFAFNILPITYIMSFWKKQTNTLISIMSQVPFCLIIADLILKVLIAFIENKKTERTVRNFQKGLFYLLPHISFFNGNLAFSLIAAQNARCRNLPKNAASIACNAGDPCCALDCLDGVCKKNFPYFEKFSNDPSLEECVMSLAFTSILYFVILFTLESKLIPKTMTKMKKFNLKTINENIDEQVKTEKHEVAVEVNKIQNKHRTNYAKQNQRDNTDDNYLSTGVDSNNLFLVYQLSKQYQKLIAVKEVSFKIKQRECFGLLGINGAGKSTTFRMLTGEEIPNNGLLYLKEKSIDSQRLEYLSQMGYCPQNNALITTLNSFDHLKLFALLRGIPKQNVDEEVRKWISKLNLHFCAQKPSGTYSGGNKRRLSIAIAMMANPSLVLLDEPTTGVDPAARRSLWDVIISCQASGQSIILTSHSMEECEALCNRLVIMVKGELVCIGASQQLKQKFGAGFDIHIKLKPNVTTATIQDLKTEIESRLPCNISDENASLITYHVTNDRLTWNAMYTAMNILKEHHSCIDDYTIISATLEQLFLQFARAAKAPSVITTGDRPSLV